MNKSRRHSSKRRLTVERVENRLMLSGDGFQSLDTDTFNLDSMGAGYVVIANDAVPQVTPTEVTPSQATDFDGTLTLVDATAIRGNFILYRDDLLPTSTDVGVTLDRLIQWRNTALQSSSLSDWRPFTDISLTSDAGDTVAGLTLNVFGSGVGREIKFATAGSLAGDALNLRANFDSVVGSVINTDSLPVSSELPTTPVSQPVVPTWDERIDVTSPVVGKVEVAVPIERLPVTDVAPSLVIAPTAPANSIIPIGQSDAQVNVGQVIDELLTSGNDFIDQALPDDADTGASDDIQLTDSGATPQVDSVFQVPVGSDKSEGQVATTGEVADEGGMIPVQGIVDALAGETIVAPNTEHVVTAEASVEITGELARVAVMELIEGEMDPAAPQAATEHTFLVATDEAAFTHDEIVESMSGDSSATFSAVRVIAGQAGLAASLVAPTNPVYLAAMMSTATDAFTAAAASAPLAVAASELGRASNARHRAFSDWGDQDAAEPQALDAPNRWLQAAPFVAVLACERVVAAKRKRQQVAGQEPPDSKGSRNVGRRPK